MPPSTTSDSEDDLDYVPAADDHDSDSTDEEDQVDNVNAAELASPEMDPAEQKKRRDTLWASFQASVSTPQSTGNGNGTSSLSLVQDRPSKTMKRVQIEKTYLFAGKHVTEVVDVPEDSEEGKKWPRWSPHARPPTSGSAPASTTPLPFSDKGEEETKGEGDRLAPPGRLPGVNPGSTTPQPSATPISGAKRPGPRKPRTALPSIPPKASQVKKITTLDKSAMDWRAHVASQSSDVKHELDANKRGGGYLDKVDFLNRVQDRREDAFEASKSSKRRKT